MANQKIFCNVPWTNTHIYWDGSFGACCSEKNRPYANSEWATYNLKNLTINEWHNSVPMKQMRQGILGHEPLPQCQGCYHEESHGYESRRIKENFKSVIFTEQAFDKSYDQTSWHDRFESAKSHSDVADPIDWHVDLGNECNLACKMCHPGASSIIASKYRTWGLPADFRKNWTNDDESWRNFITSIDNTPVNRIHFMGGEPMLSKRFRTLIKYLLGAGRTEISMSFVTNGTIYDQEIIDDLKKFRSFDLEISLESFSDNNHYIRQGLGDSTARTVNNIRMLISQQTEKFHVILRSVPQLLNVNNYYEYIQWAWDHQVAVQGIPLIRPAYLAINVLPPDIKQFLIPRYQKVKQYIQNHKSTDFATLTTGRDVSRLDLQLLRECDAIITLLQAPEPENVWSLRAELASWMMRWDNEFDLDAREFYPEYLEFFNSIGYAKV
jgi:sulfatase maturation enzyme AslB (radical SAM superfamily)